MTGPPAEGSRVAWADVPDQVRAEIESACGAAVVEAVTAPGGFSPGLAARVVCADGRRWFVKAASGEVNPDTPRLHRQEAGILADLDPLIRSGRLPAPRLRATAEHGSWFALILEDINGQHPVLPWQDEQLDQVLGDVMVTGTSSTAGDLGRATTPGTGFGVILANVQAGTVSACTAVGDALADAYAGALLPDGSRGGLTFTARASGQVPG